MNYAACWNNTEPGCHFWSAIIVNEEGTPIAITSHATSELADAWGEGFIKALDMVHMIEENKKENIFSDKPVLNENDSI